MSEVLTVAEVARLLAVSQSSVRLWIKSGRLAAKATPGGKFRVLREDAESLMQVVAPKDQVAA